MVTLLIAPTSTTNTLESPLKDLVKPSLAVWVDKHVVRVLDGILELKTNTV
jgi:hypothetical protein